MTPRLRACGELLLLAAALLVVCSPLLGRASLELDDCRYFWSLRQIDAGVPGALLSSLVVENRWDHDWWVPDGTFVRFLRPWVIASYAFDRALFGVSPTASVAVNLLLHMVVVAQFRALLIRLVGAGLPAFAGALLFTTMSCHAEHLWYIAGRTDTIGGIFFLATLLWHLRTRERPTAATRVVTALLYFASLLGKELTVWIPLLLLLLDRWVPPPGGSAPPLRAQLFRARGLWLACGLAFAGWLALRSWLLGDGGSGSRPVPYFFLPWHEHFWPRTAAVTAQYFVALATGETVIPFLSNARAWFDEVGWPDLLVGLYAVPALLLWGWSLPAGRFGVVLFLLLLVPMLPVYSSNRYLYLPSMAWCLLVTLAVQRLRGRAPWLALLLAALAIVPTSIRLHLMMRNTPYRDSHAPAQTWLLAELFRTSDVPLAPGRPIYVLDFPFTWLDLQFLQATLGVMLDRDVPPVRGLCQASPPEFPPAQLQRIGARAVELHRSGAPIHFARPGWDFTPRRLAPGDRIRERDYEAEVLEAVEGAATRIRIHFDRPLSEIELGRCTLYRDGWKLRRI